MNPIPVALLLSLASRAGTPVVYDDTDVTDVLRRVSARTAVPMDQLEGIHIQTLTERPALVSGEGSIRHCAGQTVTTTELRALQLRAESSWRAGELQDALDQLDLGIIQLGCLRERIDRKTATRMFLLRTGLLAHTGNVDGATAEANSALTLDPNLSWDPSLPSAGEAVLESARAAAHDAQLTIVPNVSTPPWVDGDALPTETASPRRTGLHLVQIPDTSGLRSAWLSLDGEAVLVLPSGFRAPALDRMEASDTAILHLFEATLGAQPTYVATTEGIWFVTYTDGEPSVETLVAPPPKNDGATAPEVIAPTHDGKRNKRPKRR